MLWTDLWRLIRSKRRVILTTACICAAAAALFALSRPIMYQAEATFRDRGMGSSALKSGAGLGGGGVLGAVLSGMGSASEQDLVSLFKSRQLLAPVIEQLGLQVVVAEEQPAGGLLGRWWDNGMAEVAHLLDIKKPVIRTPPSRLLITDVHYPGEVPVIYRLTFENSGSFRLIRSDGLTIGTGQLDQPFFSDEMSFLIKAGTNRNLDGISFHLEVSPLGPLAKKLASRIKIKPVEEREKVQRITFYESNRRRASQFVNGLMIAYQDYAKNENHRLATLQLGYLQSRQKDSFADLQTFVTQHASNVAKDLTSTGIFDTEKELEYLLKARLECCTKLTEGDLELRRLQSVDAEKEGDYRALTAANNLPQPIVDALAQLRELRRRHDVLKVALEGVANGGVSIPHPSPQGMDLKTAETIFFSLNSQRNEVEAEIKQNRFILKQLDDPAFEVSSLAGSVSDPISREIIARAGAAVLSLRDSGNRSEREQERLRDTLEQQRAFLKAHLDQSNALLLLREESLQEKVLALQRVLAELIQQQIAVSEQHLREYRSARMAHLKSEQGLLEEALGELRQRMALLPMRWASEQMIMHRLKLNKALVEEIGKFIESKNISNHLETSQSSPIDLALPPLLPKPPYVLVFAILGWTMGALTSAGLIVIRGLREGLLVSPQNLAIQGQRVAGILHREGLQWIDLLRRLCSQLAISPGDTVLSLLGHGPDYSPEFAQILVKHGWKVLRMPLLCRFPVDTRFLPGVLHVLEGKAERVSIQPAAHGDYDEAMFGGDSLYINELIRGERFKALIRELHKTYDIILVVSATVADSAEAEGLAAQFPKVIVTVGSERLHDLESLFHHPALSFVFVE